MNSIGEIVTECCANGCHNTSSDPGIQFIKLPEDHKERGMLLKRIGRDDLLEMPARILKKYSICSRHFGAVGMAEDDPRGDMELKYQTQSPNEMSGSLKYKSSKYRVKYSPYELPKNQNIQPAQEQMKQYINPLGALKVQVHKQGQFYPSSSEMLENLREVDRERIGRQDDWLLCEKCGRLFPSLRELNKHQAAADSVTNLEDSKINLQNKVGGKTVVEQQLPNSSSQYSAQLMSVHPELQSTSTAGYHPCTKCTMCFKNQTSLKKHIKTIHNEAYCFGCDKVFKSKYYMHKHQTEHCPGRSLYN